MRGLSIKTWLENLEFIPDHYVDGLNTSLTFLITAFFGWVAYMLVKKWIARVVMKIAKKTSMDWDDVFFDHRFFNKLGWLIMPIVIRIGTTTIAWDGISIVDKFLYAWIVLAASAFLIQVLSNLNNVYDSFPVSKDKPIKVFVQVVDLFIGCAAAVILIGLFTDTQVTNLLAGMAAFAAVLILIFQNSILGFVAGIQLSANNMVKIDDWIVMPNAGADGFVIEINLTTVKVQNWDKTITTIPTYKMVSESFTNWRGMFTSQGRRIKRSINIDVNSVRYLTESELEDLKQSELLRDYIDGKLKELKEYNANRSELDARKLTNLGTFRGYIELWITQNPNINLNMLHLVRQLQPGPTGIPLEVYCFSARQDWISYENVQSDIFDHLYAIMPLFHLKVFQYGGGFPVENPAAISKGIG